MNHGSSALYSHFFCYIHEIGLGDVSMLSIGIVMENSHPPVHIVIAASRRSNAPAEGRSVGGSGVAGKVGGEIGAGGIHQQA